VVAFEPSDATRGESCRDVTARLADLQSMRLDEAAGERLRSALNGSSLRELIEDWPEALIVARWPEPPGRPAAMPGGSRGP